MARVSRLCDGITRIPRLESADGPYPARSARDKLPNGETTAPPLQPRVVFVSSLSASQSYPLAIRDSSLTTAFGLLMRTLPYALARFAVMMAAAIACIVWAVVTIGGAEWLGNHIAKAFGAVWLIGGLVVAGWLWATLFRYLLHLIDCGHVAVLTELIVHGRISNGRESMFAYGRRIVTERFGEVSVLFAMNLTGRGILNAFHQTLDWIGELLPIPGLDSIANLLTTILRAATRYMDKAVFSYNLACNAENPWENARDGIIYYCQNAKPILQTSVWIVAFEYVSTAVVWLVLLIPAAAITVMLPHSLREMGGLVTVGIAILFTWAARAAFVKPLFLIMIMTRFHALIENQPINAEWVGYLDQLSDKFRDLGQRARTFGGVGASRPAPGPAPAV
jgi:hypothetical protein